MEQIPVIICGERCGTVRFRRDGAYMLCCGQVRYSGDVQRLWLYGEGDPGYLGVLMPDGKGSASIRKRFSLAEFSRLPKPISYCGTQQDRKPAEEEISEKESDVIWHAMGDGTLVRNEGEHRYVAFPADGVRLPRGGEFLLRQIEGRTYVVFLS